VAVRIYFDFEVSITQRTESDFIGFTALDFVVLGEKAKANQATNTFAVRAGWVIDLPQVAQTPAPIPC
jgi:hypothetical protein